MKSTLYLLLGILIPTLLCGQEMEPNNTPAQANILTLTNLKDTITGTIGTNGDEDYFKFSVTQPTVVNIFANSPADMAIYMRLYNAANTQLQSVGASENGGQTPLIKQLICDPGQYYIRMARNNGAGSSTSPYTVYLSLDVTDIHECNNSFDMATSINGNTFQGKIDGKVISTADEDYFKFNVPKPCVINLLAISPSDLKVWIRLYNSNQTQLESKSASNYGGQATISQLVCQPGDYIIRIANGGGSFDNQFSNEFYQVVITLDSSDIHECNNSFSTAKTITGSTFQGKIKGKVINDPDEDYFKFNVPKPCIINLLASSPSDLKIWIRLFDPNHTQLGSKSANEYGGQAIITASVCPPGDYFIKVVTGGGSFDNQVSDEFYQVLITLDSSDVYECNNTFATASMVNCNTPVLASINTADDNDCFKITLTQPDIITVNVTNVPSNLNLTVTLAGPAPSITEIKKVNGNTGAPVTLVSPNILQPGTYYVCVTDDKASTAQYQLNINCPSVVGTEENQLSESVFVYPNPTKEILYLDIRGSFNPNEYHIKNSIGQLILQSQISAGSETIDLGKLSAGLYIIEVKGAKGTTSRQFIKL